MSSAGGDTLRSKEQELQALQEEIHGTAERLRYLRTVETGLQEQIFALKQQTMTIAKIDSQRKAQQLAEEIEKRDVKLRQLQASVEAAMADREQFASELSRVMTISDSPAGRKQSSLAPSTSRLEAAGAVGGSDPLGQGLAPSAPAPAAPVRSGAITDSLGAQKTASPLVRPEDFVVQGQRPETAHPSTRFGEWRPRSRITQPPGGRSSNIFG